MPIKVQVGSQIVEFPDGTPEAEMLAALEQLPQTPAASHTAPEPTPEHPHARTWRLVKKNAPAIAAAAATAAVPALGAYTIPAQLVTAGGAGYLGARVRGDERGDAAVEGIKQAGLQGSGEVLSRALGALANATMRGGIPKNIQSDFGGKDIAQKALDTGAVPGVASSARRVSRLSGEANQARDAAAKIVPPMSRSKVIEGLRPIHREAVTAREPQLADDVLTYMRDSARNIGPKPMSGAEQLARKSVKQREGKAALTAANPRTAAVTPQLADAERSAIMAHLRQTPEMAKALDDSQGLMGLDRWMKDAETTSMLMRARQSLPSALLSPTGLAVTAHGINAGSKVVSPQMLRALELMRQLEEQ